MLPFPHRPFSLSFSPPLFPTTHNTPLPTPSNPPETHPTRTFTHPHTAHPNPFQFQFQFRLCNETHHLYIYTYIHIHIYIHTTKPQHQQTPPQKKTERAERKSMMIFNPLPPLQTARFFPQLFVSISFSFFARKTGSREIFDSGVKYWR